LGPGDDGTPLPVALWEAYREGIDTKYKNDGLWSPAAFDAWRWAIAEQIMALQKALE